MRIVFMGTPDFAVPCLRRLHDDGHDIALVVSQPDKPKGRKMVLTPPAVKEEAIRLGLDVYQPGSLKSEEALVRLQALQPDLIVVVAYGKLLPDAVLAVPKLGCINVHSSILPHLRGAGPIQWSILLGDEETGVTTMYMASKLDAGDTIDTVRISILEDETAGELFERLQGLGAALLSKTVFQIEQGMASRTPQDEEKATYAPMLDKKMAWIDWRKSMQEIHNFVRGLNPWPVAQTMLAGKPTKILSTRKTDRKTSLVPGAIVEASAKGGLFVACGDRGVIEITRLQAEGAKALDAAAFLRGRPVDETQRLTSPLTY